MQSFQEFHYCRQVRQTSYATGANMTHIISLEASIDCNTSGDMNSLKSVGIPENASRTKLR